MGDDSGHAARDRPADGTNQPVWPRPCPVCGSREADEIHRHRFVLFDDHPLAGDCVTAACRDCGMGFNRAVRRPEDYARHYAELSKYVANYSPRAGAEDFEAHADALERTGVDRHAAVLDIGFGAGGFLAALHRRGYRRLAGLDPTPAAVAGVKRELPGVDARVGVAGRPPFTPGSFDVAVSTSVLEHLLRPDADLDHMARLLAPGGRVFAIVPDASRYDEFMDAPFQDFNIEHVNHFSPATLAALFARRGWRPLETGAAVMSITPHWRQPIAYGAFAPPAGGEARVATPEADRQLGRALASYTANSAALLARIEARLEEQLAGEAEILLWGAGQGASVLLGQTSLGARRLRAVVDGNPAYAGRRLAGAPVGGPELRGDFAGPVVVATLRQQVPVTRRIRGQLMWDNRVVTLVD